MMKDVPHAKTIFGLGLGGLIFGVVMLTWVYPLFCCRVSQVKETKVREYMEGRYGISDRSVDALTSSNQIREELPKTAGSDGAEASADIGAGDGNDAASPEEDAPGAESDEAENSLPPAKRH